MKQIYLMIFLLVAVTSGVCLAQTKSKKSVNAGNEILTNASIVNLNDAGLGDDLIISKIENSQTNFDLSSSGLVALKSKKVDNDIIKAMLNKNNHVKPGAKADSAPLKAANRLPTIDLVNQVYSFIVLANSALPIEKGVANLKHKIKLMGYGGADIVYILDGEKSPSRLNKADSVCFLINTGGGAPELTLYKLEISKHNRQALTQKVNGMTAAMTSGKNTIPYNVANPQPGIYKITPAAKLAPGEYFFGTKPNISATTIDVYAFGID